MISDDIWNFDTSPQTCSSLGPYKLSSRCKHHLTINMSLENTHILFLTYRVIESFQYPYFSSLTKRRPWSDSGSGLGSLKMESFTVPRPLILGQVQIDKKQTKKTKRPLTLMDPVLRLTMNVRFEWLRIPNRRMTFYLLQASIAFKSEDLRFRHLLNKYYRHRGRIKHLFWDF